MTVRVAIMVTGSRHRRLVRRPLPDRGCCSCRVIRPAVVELFSQHGTVDAVSLPTDRETGRPRGFGFVEMSQTDAARAIQSLNGYSMNGRPLRVNEAQDKPRTGGGRPDGGGFRGNGANGGNTGGAGGGRW